MAKAQFLVDYSEDVTRDCERVLVTLFSGQNPWLERSALPARRPSSHRRPRCRHRRCARRAGARPRYDMKALLADKGYDGDKLRAQIIDLGAKPVIPNKSNRVVIPSLQQASLQGPQRHRTLLLPPKTSGASPLATTSWLVVSSLQFISQPPSHTRFN